MRHIRSAAILATLAVLALPRPASAQAPTLIVQATPAKVSATSASANKVASAPKSIRSMKVSGEEIKVSLAAQNATACQMQTPDGQWIGIPTNYSSYSIGPNSLGGKKLSAPHPWYPKAGESKMIRFSCVGANRAVVTDSIRLSRTQ